MDNWNQTKAMMADMPSHLKQQILVHAGVLERITLGQCSSEWKQLMDRTPSIYRCVELFADSTTSGWTVTPHNGLPVRVEYSYNAGTYYREVTKNEESVKEECLREDWFVESVTLLLELLSDCEFIDIVEVKIEKASHLTQGIDELYHLKTHGDTLLFLSGLTRRLSGTRKLKVTRFEMLVNFEHKVFSELLACFDPLSLEIIKSPGNFMNEIVGMFDVKKYASLHATLISVRNVQEIHREVLTRFEKNVIYVGLVTAEDIEYLAQNFAKSERFGRCEMFYGSFIDCEEHGTKDSLRGGRDKIRVEVKERSVSFTLF